ncbi:doubled CXXCH motif [bacterium BMS3Abin05]|nr:doubled CXXCH motif [bacterium BMS3Abin05]GBE27338.1 doubled CXXCH motif [bacterium BMS3Bbin03]
MRISQIRRIYQFFAILFFLIFLNGAGQSQSKAVPQLVKLQWKKCLICHAKPGLKKVTSEGEVISLFVNQKELAHSIHKNVPCQQCHMDIVTIPHKGAIKRVDCSRCHYAGSPIEPKNTKRYAQLQNSVHGIALAKGNPNAPRCQDCHGGHDVYPPSDSSSHINKFRVAKTCGKCHPKEYNNFEKSIHAKALNKHKSEAPTCINCHGGHTIESPKQKTSSVYASRIPDTCSKCHGSIKVVGPFGIPTQQVTTYKNSFHGIATQFGEIRAANCASCHGYHSILPASNPNSRINKKNLPKTCGKCHKNINRNVELGKVHVNPRQKSAGIIFYVSSFFKYLTITVLVALMLHIILDVNHKLREKRAGKKKETEK